MKFCSFCGRAKHTGVCDMVELVDGRLVHSSRVEKGGDLAGAKIKNRWIKRDMLGRRKV